MPTTINNELSRILKIQYLESLSASDLAFWLINSFTPDRYRDRSDVIEPAIRLLFQKSHAPELLNEFVERLWGMHGLVPDYQASIENGKVVAFRRNV